jgi:nucleoside-diphosphate-sugar epimerase
LVPLVADAGHEPVLFDSRPIETPYESFQGDIRDFADVQAALRGADLVVHLAAILGNAATTPHDFYEINLTGTFNMWEAAARAGMRGLVFSSTMSVYKPHDRPLREDALTEVREDLLMRPRDMYGYTKATGEEMCRLYGRTHGIPSVALRYGMFSPEPFFPYGIRLLYGGVDADDVAQAVLASVEALLHRRIRYDAFNVESLVPFSQEDEPLLLRDPLAAIDKYYPGSADLLRSRGVTRLAPIREYYSMSHAANSLGFRPECNFDRWLEVLRSRPEERAENDPPWP